ncbi:hypothetical protein [Mycobacterium sp.]|uniref:hypothetical protein n=1 Tax=Mycobacterium sp. TaxID=1785 RepID=UPI0012792C2E|nr:hypothetical protein [Mycobacterium sp.]KAA8967059.1 MAG: hypothetical protein F6Q13_06745 [Mycobacterium sp.]
MGMQAGFAPWMVFWVLVANVPPGVAVVAALVVATAVFGVKLAARSSHGALEIGAVAVFPVLAMLIFSMNPRTVERWALALSNAGICLAALTGVLIGKPLLGVAGRRADAEPFVRLTTLLSRVWVAVFAAMTVSSAIPPIVSGDVTIAASTRPLAFVGYWVIPVGLFAVAALVTGALLERAAIAVDNVPRKTTFVAYGEATIDELYYLAQQHANREVGAAREAYDVKVGGMGTPLVGDDSRKSWPATYKVRERR